MDKKKAKPKAGAGGKAAPAAKPKGPGKAALAAMKETLAKIKAEEEKALQAELEAEKKAEEAQKQAEEKARLEKERRELKKKKEKERIERLKKEGKYLTAKQKVDRARAQQALEVLKAQGLVAFGKRVKTAQQEEEQEDGEDHNDDGDESPEQNDIEEQDDEEGDVADGEEPEEHEEEGDEEVEDWEQLAEELEKAKVDKNGKTNGSVAINDKKSQTVSSKTLVKQSSKEEKVSPEEDYYSAPSAGSLRSPIICVLGHVDTGKTKLLDYLRKSHVQDNEAGGITQQIGATYVPPKAINEHTKVTKKQEHLRMPGLLIIDTPGHESFTNLRSRGSSLCDIAILVIDIMHGLEPQTIESINLLKSRKTPFVVALNKIDRLYNWKPGKSRDVEDVIKGQESNTKLEFDKRTKQVILELNQLALNAALFYENPNPKEYISLIPTSAHSGDGMGNLINLIVTFSQTLLTKRLIFDVDKLEATVLEVKAITGLGTTIDVVLVNGFLKEGDRIVLAGHDGPIVTNIRSLLVPQPLKELRIKTPYKELKTVYGSMGVKVTGHELERAVAGLELAVARKDCEVEPLKESCWNRFGEAMKAIKCSEKGVYVQASTLGSLEALLEFLKASKIPYSNVRIGPVVKRDVMKASTMLESSPDHAIILAFDVKVERDAQEMADSLGVKIFTAEIIYHLFDQFTAYQEQLKAKKKEQFKHLAVFPCKLRILPQHIFNARDPIVFGVSVEDGLLVPGTPIAVPSKENLELGRVTSIQINNKDIENARRGQEVCIKIEHHGSDAPKLYGRHFDHTDMLVSKITRESIDAVKEYFREEMTKADWQLMIQLKNDFQIL